jgi:hypothetical protein
MERVKGSQTHQDSAALDEQVKALTSESTVEQPGTQVFGELHHGQAFS